MTDPLEDKAVEPARADAGQRLTLATKATGLLVRLVGVVLLLFGFWTAIQVVIEAWSLYEDPSRVERFAVAIDQGSNIDRLLNPELSESGGQSEPPAEVLQFRFSYFIAWAVVLLLLMLIGRLTIWFIRTGGELALYDVQVRRVARTLMRQAQKPEKKISS